MGLFLGVGTDHLLQVAETLWTGLETLLGRGIRIEVPHLHGGRQKGRQRHIAVAIAGREHRGFRAHQTGNPGLRKRLLDRLGPGIDVAIFVMLALVPPGPIPGPGLENEVVGFVEALTVVGRIDIVGDLLAAGATHPAGHQAAAGNHVDDRQLLGQAQGVGHGQRIAHQRNLHPPGDARQDRGLDIHDRAQGKGVGVVLIEHHAIEAQFLGVEFFVQVAIEQRPRLYGIQKAVGNTEETCVADHFFFGDRSVGPLGKGRNVHDGSSPRSAGGIRTGGWRVS